MSGLPNVNIVVNRSGLGLVAFTNDGIMGLVLTGIAAVVPGVQLLDPVSLYGIADAEAMSITEGGTNAAAWKQIKEFYQEAGNGTKLWIILSDEDKMSTNVYDTCAARTLVEKAKGEISLLGVVRGTTQGIIIVDGLNEDVVATITNAQLLAEEYQGKIMPFSVVIDGLGFDGDADVVSDLKEMTNNRCSIVLAAADSSKVSAVGQYLGRLAAIPVQRKASRVKDGPVTNMDGFLTDGDSVDNRDGILGTLHDKGYIVYRQFPHKAGVYFSGDPTATAATDDLSTIARNRIIDKVLKIAYNTYIEELDDDVPMTDAGKVAPAVCGYLKSKIELQVKSQMSDEISVFYAVVSDNQNILSGLPFEIELNIIPKGYLGTINVKIGFTNPYLNS